MNLRRISCGFSLSMNKLDYRILKIEKSHIDIYLIMFFHDFIFFNRAVRFFAAFFAVDL